MKKAGHPLRLAVADLTEVGFDVIAFLNAPSEVIDPGYSHDS